MRPYGIGGQWADRFMGHGSIAPRDHASGFPRQWGDRVGAYRCTPSARIDRTELALGDLAYRRAHGDAPLRDLGGNGPIDIMGHGAIARPGFTTIPDRLGRAQFSVHGKTHQSFRDSLS